MMLRLFTLIFVGAIFALFTACSNPADNAPKAVVSEAKATVAPAIDFPIQGKKLVFSQDNASINFIGSKVTGIEDCSFQKFSGTIDLVDEKAEKSRVLVVIDTNSVVAKIGKLTEHLKSPDFFDVAKYPHATFTSTEIKAGGDKGASHTVTGTLELRGIKKTVTFPATIKIEADAVTMNSEFAVNRKDFGMVYPGKADDLIRDEVLLKLAVKAPRTK